MSTIRVDFYLLRQAAPDGKLRAVCRLANKIYQLGQTAFVYAASAGQARRLDELLWVFDQGSFVPHCRLDDREAPAAAPIVISHNAPPCETAQNVLISLLDEVPGHYQDFSRVAEMVDADDADKARARARFRYYRSQGCALGTHEISP